MKKIIFVLVFALSLVGCKDDDVTPAKTENIVLVVKQKPGATYTITMQYTINGISLSKTSTNESIELDTILKVGDNVGLGVQLKNSMDQIVTGDYEYTLIKQNGTIGAGIICSGASPSCNSYITYTIK